ncbi:MAG TPA: transcriptional regulator [Clostridiales bacterium]|jgi:DNA-binding HxlR family transcriptional regulator|nr:helix-turn-helix transcriptional regulator [Clostridia bacterium]MBR3255803.1 helix-turn-helix transcriptional regulator [Clostridia bacterium]HCC03543.1 transcriptional regulator [Clostridiales bacterium]
MKKLYTKCPVEYTVSIISDKWKVLIIRDLLEKEKRYSELMKSVVGISDKVLAKNLRELEQDGIINRKVYAVVPPKVEYSLTEKGQELKQILKEMEKFGLKYREE